MKYFRGISLLLLVNFIIFWGYMVVHKSYSDIWASKYSSDFSFYAVPITIFIAFLAAQIILNAKGFKEYILLPLVNFLTGFGFMFLLRLAGGSYQNLSEKSGNDLFSQYGTQHKSFFIAYVIFLLIIFLVKDYKIFARYKYIIGFLAVGLLLVTSLLGTVVNGQTLSLSIKGISFQPHELIKLLVAIFVASYLHDKKELISVAAGKFGFFTKMDLRYMGPLVAMWLLIILFIVYHGDLGAAMLLFGIFIAIIYLGTNRWIYAATGLGLALLAITIASTMISRVQYRIGIWLNPFSDASGSGYQIAQSLMAVGAGRIFGAGIGNGYPERIPQIHTDMVYAALSEDLGLIGMIVVLLVFIVMISRFFYMGSFVKDNLNKLLLSGFGVIFALQTIVIVCGTLSLIPLTGITLPFISYGGSSLVVNMMIIALACAFYTQGVKENENI